MAKKHLGVDEEKFKIQSGQATMMASKSAHSTYRYLWDASFSIFSQFGEDGILDYLCDVLDITKPRILELGSGNFNECNSRFLAEFRSAEVVAVDARKDLVSSISKMELNWKNHIFPIQVFVTPETVNEIEILASENMGEVNILSIDLDGNDYWIASKMALSKTRIIVVEYNPLFGFKRAVSVFYKSDFDRTKEHYSWDYYGASIKAWQQLFSKSDFSFIGTNRQCTNAFFIKNEDVNKLGFQAPKDLSIFTNLSTRDSRDLDSNISIRSKIQRISDISNLTVVDVTSNEELTVKQLWT